MSQVPGPSGRAALALLPQLRRDPLALLTGLARRHGERVRLPMPSTAGVYLLSKPDDVAHVLVSNQQNYVKAPVTYRPLMGLLGNGLLTNEGEDWLRQRKLVQPMFARRHLVEFGSAMVDAASDLLDRWSALPDGAEVDVAREMSALTLDVVGRALFGADLTGEAAAMAPALDVALETYVRLLNNPLYWALPGFERVRTPSRRRAEHAEARLRGVVERIIATRQAQADPDTSDLLGMLLAAGDALSGKQLRDELMTFLLAGHETTSTALAWTFLLLSTHPEARVVLESEVEEVLGDRAATAADADKLTWTGAVVSEAMRLYPPAWIFEREAVADDDLPDMRIPRGALVAISPYLVHRNSAHWPNPEGFDPERFLPSSLPGRHRYAYLPFGGGRRQCVGSGFAMLEATLLLAEITRRYRLDLVPGARPVPQPTVTLRPGNGIPMTLHRR